MRVFVFAHSAGWGGAERSLLFTLNGLVQRGFEIQVAVPREGPWIEQAKQCGIESIVFPHKWWAAAERSGVPGLARVAMNQLRLRAATKLVQQFFPHVIYSNTVVIPMGAMTAQKLGLPHVWHLREYGFADHGLRFALGWKRAAQWMRRSGSLYVTNSRALGTYYQKWLPIDDVHVATQGLDITGLQNLSQSTLPVGQRYFVSAGSLVPGKGHELAIHGFSHIAHDYQEVALRIVGTGPTRYASHLRDIVDRLGLSERVSFAGYRDDLPGILRGAHAVIVASSSEAFGRVTAESMILGTPVIGAASGGTVELLEDGAGYLFQERDPVSLATRLVEVLEDDARYQSVVKKATLRSQDLFSGDKYIGRMQEILNKASLLGKNVDDE